MHLDWRQLLRALEHTGSGQYGLDPDTGRLRFFDLHELYSEDPEELWELERFLLVEPLPLWCGQGWVREFAELVEGEEARLLAAAAEQERPITAVRRLLAESDELRQRWEAYYQAALAAEAEAWAAEAGLQPANLPPWREVASA